MSLIDELKEMDGDWQGAEARRGQFTVLPEGRYSLEVVAPTNGEWIAENKDKAIRARFLLKVVGTVDESLEGKMISKSYVLRQSDGSPGETGFGILKGDLEIMGVAVPESLSRIAEAMQACEGKVIDATAKITEKASGTYNNIYFNSVQFTEGTKPEVPF